MDVLMNVAGMPGFLGLKSLKGPTGAGLLCIMACMADLCFATGCMSRSTIGVGSGYNDCFLCNATKKQLGYISKGPNSLWM